MAENLDVLNTAVSLLIRAVLLATRFSGRVRQRYLKRLAPKGIDAKTKEIIFLKDRGYQPNQVWSSDITYIRRSQGFAYLVAILDWFSRYVLSWSLSTTLDAWFCVQALREALWTGRPKIVNTDQGSQFTSGDWIGELTGAGVVISMDGRGRTFDNIFTERLWRSVKYEQVYLQDY